MTGDTNMKKENTINQEQEEMVFAEPPAQVIFNEKKETDDIVEDDAEEIDEEDYDIENNEDKIRKALSEGKTICEGILAFEERDCICTDEGNYDLPDICQAIWHILEENSEGNFDVINDDLEY